MPATINPIRKARVKRELLNPHNNISEALIKAGYSEKSARGKSGAMKVVKVCQAEITQELLSADITVDLIITRLNQDRELAKAKGDISTMTRADELLGKYLAMFVDKTENTTKLVIKPDEVSELNRLRGNLFNITHCIPTG